MITDGVKLDLWGARADMFVAQLRADAAFITDLNIMDYSLLVSRLRCPLTPHLVLYVLLL